MIRRRGFTLVEMLIVGALIALFSGIAIIGIQAQYRSNQRKAVIGETRQVASALDFAYNDIGFFPKISHLMLSRTNMELESDIKYGNPVQTFRLLDAFGIPLDVARAERVATKWRGGYFAASQSRTRISQGRGGSRKMITDSIDTVGYDWPLDVWNNPYVLYCLNIDPDTRSLYFVVNDRAADGTFSLNTTPGREGNFVNAVVSYGPNQVPGGGEIYVANGAPGNNTPGSDSGDYTLRLYTGDPNSIVNPLYLKRGNELLIADPDAQRMANAWTRKLYSDAGFSIANGAFPSSGTPDPIDLGDGITNSNALGITDSGSDDVVFTF